MKKLLFLLLILASFGAGAQTVTLNIGTDGYVTINGQNFKRGDLRSRYTYNLHDSTLAIYYATDRLPFITTKVDTMFLYGDSTNAKARNMVTLRTWMNTNFEFKH